MCDNCGYVHYVNPVPGVGIVIEMDGGIVLIQRGHNPHKGQWALPSGFVEADESAEEAAIREAAEETGLKVEIIELAAINSFPEGPPVSGIMLFYRARPIGGHLQAGDDAHAVKVFQPQELPLLPFRTHREMLAQWLESQRIERQAATPNTTPELTLRLATETDLDEVVALLELIPANRELSAEAWQKVRWRIRESDTLEVTVAEMPHNPKLIIGCASLSIVRGLTDSAGIIGDMAVLPTYQRRGVGAALLKSLMQRADELNLNNLWVNKTRANDQARAFYAALGFEDLELLRLRMR
jgi:ADP-ribose pyrophosphatase YjhB (NUDIX family)/N-acetylglutamate synthase-like GNAT family acetyltransferase